MPLPSTGMTLHLDASDTDRLWKEAAMTTHPANGEVVIAWDDEGDATNFAHINGSGPLYAAAGINGLGALDFTGGNKLLRVRDDANTANQALSNFITTSAYTLFVAAMMTGNSPNAAVFQNAGLLSTSGQNWGLFTKTIAGVHSISAVNFDANYDEVSLPFTLNTSCVFLSQHSGGNLIVDVNDSGSPASVASGNTGGSMSGIVSTGVDVFTGAAAVPGLIGEIVMYNTVLAGTDLADAWAYFLDKWVTPPVTGSPWTYFASQMSR